ncbi:hypothetical protein CWI38_0474p0010 [Hamiltosporidium tvaerminnensis]|uniref:Uncharacterized protein n=3 Tax=Hamiltosporidium TaxID=1176354 RepID=A0A4Q9LX12_9MICR|nr:hypothetical protein LUQ84_001480 [Hamiltosporidium tvaerminnensis]TBU00891.1 hypothetical protein CWI37_0868p0010 [Hamiltosporidium tvaerminnensis]TBU02331.1 hypothetical protein CWI36_1139p0010 [Hamiltosporidium magnivora]TBU13298.1 hypothetical protein CWI38_0474p0010 [Hamiltosporidium tvaerminnensis]
MQKIYHILLIILLCVINIVYAEPSKSSSSKKESSSTKEGNSTGGANGTSGANGTGGTSASGNSSAIMKEGMSGSAVTAHFRRAELTLYA